MILGYFPLITLKNLKLSNKKNLPLEKKENQFIEILKENLGKDFTKASKYLDSKKSYTLKAIETLSLQNIRSLHQNIKERFLRKLQEKFPQSNGKKIPSTISHKKRKININGINHYVEEPRLLAFFSSLTINNHEKENLIKEFKNSFLLKLSKKREASKPSAERKLDISKNLKIQDKKLSLSPNRIEIQKISINEKNEKKEKSYKELEAKEINELEKHTRRGSTSSETIKETLDYKRKIFPNASSNPPRSFHEKSHINISSLITPKEFKEFSEITDNREQPKKSLNKIKTRLPKEEKGGIQYREKSLPSFKKIKIIQQFRGNLKGNIPIEKKISIINFLEPKPLERNALNISFIKSSVEKNNPFVGSGKFRKLSRGALKSSILLTTLPKEEITLEIEEINNEKTFSNNKNLPLRTSSVLPIEMKTNNLERAKKAYLKENLILEKDIINRYITEIPREKETIINRVSNKTLDKTLENIHSSAPTRAPQGEHRTEKRDIGFLPMNLQWQKLIKENITVRTLREKSQKASEPQRNAIRIKIPLDEKTTILIRLGGRNLRAIIQTEPKTAAILYNGLNNLIKQINSAGYFNSAIISISVSGGGNNRLSGGPNNNFSQGFSHNSNNRYSEKEKKEGNSKTFFLID